MSADPSEDFLSPQIADIEIALAAYATDAQICTAIAKKWGLRPERVQPMIEAIRARHAAEKRDPDTERWRLVRLCEDGIRRARTSTPPDDRAAMAWAKMMADILGFTGKAAAQQINIGGQHVHTGAVSLPIQAPPPELDERQRGRITDGSLLIDEE